MQNQKNWYTRRGDQVRGPFPAGLISRYILLGRIRLDDELSVDRETWRPVSEIEELIPGVLKADANDPRAQERLKAARRWADERLKDRRGERGGETPAAGSRRRASDRRQPESSEVLHHRTVKSSRALGGFSSPAKWGVAVVGGIAVFVAALMLFSEPASHAGKWDCNAPPQPGVNWNDCQMPNARLDKLDLTGATLRNTNLQGASLRESKLRDSDLSFANLSSANLANAHFNGATILGANFRGADLSNADLSGADLSYADFSGADLTGANFSGARLDNAIWTDRSLCAKGSLGRCIH
ncbi:MAG: pentapeptide repeat-containing protein [Gammaproteobacteria bacterium]|nr:pentapeptide repeat-containing protein [Gammaproteobacteria bacterium]